MQAKQHNRIKKVLIANRGEIALRVVRACKKLGISYCIAVSEADKELSFATQADESVVIGPAAAQESYLNINRIIDAAKERGCDAVHPGYGFLSENAAFAKAVIQAGMRFIGPTPEAIEIMGSKVKARALVSKHGVPCTAGVFEELSDEALSKAAKEIGFPVIIKAVAGGGGRGMRVVHKESELADALKTARAEAKKFFAHDGVYLERYFPTPRHVEVQVFGDSFGNVVHLGTRDCSLQRRHQKVIEEAPAPFLGPTTREKIHQAAVSAARAVKYENAGTIEFLVDGDEFFFLEMNTRIQVEHPVTEVVTGIDLVELQLKVAQGEKLPFEQKDIKFSGHAVELRICAEDPEHNFAPTRGTLRAFQGPSSPHVRQDLGFSVGDSVSLFYDGMLGKLIIHGESRDQALQRAYQCARTFRIEGLGHNLELLRWALRQEAFRKQGVDIHFLERNFSKQSLRDLRASEVQDPAYIAPLQGAEHVEHVRYHSKLSQTEISIDIIHARDGNFYALPYLLDGSPPQEKFCRASNGRNAALGTLIEEVLEKVPLKDL